MNLQTLTTEELDEVMNRSLMENFTRLTFAGQFTAYCRNVGIDVTTASIKQNDISCKILNDPKLTNLSSTEKGVKTGFNPYPMVGVNPNDVFCRRNKRK